VNARPHFRTAGTGLLVLLAACASGSGSRSAVPPGEGTRLELGGSVHYLAEGAGERFTAEELARELERLLGGGRFGSASVLAERFPDLWLSTLQAPPNGCPRAVALVAERFDARAQGSGGQRAQLRDLVERPEAYTAFRERRAELLRLLRAGELADAARCELPLPKDAPTDWPRIEAAEWTGWIARARGRAAEAAEAFREAASLARPLDARTARRLDLLAFQTGAGDDDTPPTERGAEWSALAGGRELLDGTDPRFLELALRARPDGTPWPAGLSPRRILARIGSLRLGRDEPEAALRSLREASTHAGLEPSNDALRLATAKAFAALGQTDVARSLLVGLTPTSVAPEAFVALGILETRAGRFEVARAMMRRGLAGVPVEEEPTLHADLALVELLCGDDDDGALQRLSLVESALRERGERGELIRLLENELAFHALGGTEASASVVESRLEALEARDLPATARDSTTDRP